MSGDQMDMDIYDVYFVPQSQTSNAAEGAVAFFGASSSSQDSLLSFPALESQPQLDEPVASQTLTPECGSQEYALSQETKDELVSDQHCYHLDLGDEDNYTDPIVHRIPQPDEYKKLSMESQSGFVGKAMYEVVPETINYVHSMNNLDAGPWNAGDVIQIKADNSEMPDPFSIDEIFSSQPLVEEKKAVMTLPEPKNKAAKKIKAKKGTLQGKKTKAPKAVSSGRKTVVVPRKLVKLAPKPIEEPSLEALESRQRFNSESSTATSSKYEADSESSMQEHPSTRKSVTQGKAGPSTKKARPVKKTSCPPMSEEYKEKRRKSNAEAAKRCREKKKKQQQETKNKLEEQESKNQQLKMDIENIKSEFYSVYADVITANINAQHLKMAEDSMIKFRDKL